MSLSRAAKAALRQAGAEGVTLLRSADNSTGYKSVSFKSSLKSKPYQAQVKRGGKTMRFGYFATAEEAALSIARLPETHAAAAPPPPLTAEEALRQAEAEGLTLLKSDSSSTGFKCVAVDSRNKINPYLARVTRGGKFVHLGYFATAEEAALCYARTPEAQAAAAALALSDMTAEEALAQAEAEGLTLLRSESNRTGYTGVSCDSRHKCKSKPYQAKVKRDCQHLSLGYFATAEERGSKFVHLGYFATAEEAALCYARASAAQTAAPQPPATSSRKRKVRSEEQPPDMPADLVVILEGRFVDTTFEYYGL